MYETSDEEDLYDSDDEKRDDDDHDLQEEEEQSDEERYWANQRHKEERPNGSFREKKRPNSETSRDVEAGSDKKNKKDGRRVDGGSARSESSKEFIKRKEKDATRRSDESTVAKDPRETTTKKSSRCGPCTRCEQDKPDENNWRADLEQSDRPAKERDTVCNACWVKLRKRLSEENGLGDSSAKNSSGAKKIKVQDREGPCEQCGALRPNQSEDNKDKSWKIEPPTDDGRDESCRMILCQSCYKITLNEKRALDKVKINKKRDKKTSETDSKNRSKKSSKVIRQSLSLLILLDPKTDGRTEPTDRLIHLFLRSDPNLLDLIRPSRPLPREKTTEREGNGRSVLWATFSKYFPTSRNKWEGSIPLPKAFLK